MPTILESKDDFQNLVFTDYERTLCHKLRTMLMDLPDDVFRSLNTLVEKDYGEHWIDQMLLTYLQYSMGLMNAFPLQTNYSMDSLPTAWESPLLLGAMIQALWGISVKLNFENVRLV